MTDYPTLVASLRTQLADAKAQHAETREKRRPFALAVIETDDADAKMALAEIDTQAETLRQRVETIEVAIEEAEARASQAERDAEAADRRRRRAESASLSFEVLKLSAEVDRLAGKLTDTLRERRDLIHKLGGLGILDLTMLNTLQERLRPSAAFVAAGLHPFLNLQTLPSQGQPLAEADMCLSVRLEADHPEPEVA